MPEDAESLPVKRGPGRPRKVATPKVVDAAPPDAWRTSDGPTIPPDPRIGQHVDDARWTSIGFDDGSQYRCESGIIVERVN